MGASSAAVSPAPISTSPTITRRKVLINSPSVSPTPSTGSSSGSSTSSSPRITRVRRLSSVGANLSHPGTPRKSAVKRDRRFSAAEDYHSHDPNVPVFTAVLTYINYAILIFFGHVRDTARKLTRTTRYRKSTPPGYAPLVSEFEDFYTRRMYHRLQDNFNRPINSCPAATIDVMCRDFTRKTGDRPRLNGEVTAALNLGSYNYLGFGDPDSVTKPSVFAALEQYGTSTCSTRNSLGTLKIHTELEKYMAEYVGKEDAMIFGMGHGTNTTTIPALIGKGGLIISDSINHNSLVVGSRTSGAVIRVFKHNDADDLEQVVRQAIIDGQPNTHRPWTKILVMIEGIYSMEGEMSPLPEIVRIKKQYKCYLYVDEAHSIGAVGPTGRGVCDHFNVDPADVDILMGTFTKSFGAVGGYVAADRNIIEFMRAHSAGHVYSASISPPATQQIISALRIIAGETHGNLGQQKIQQLRSNANYFRQRMMDMNMHVLGTFDSPVVPVMLYNPSKIGAFGREALKVGIAAVVVGFPASPLILSRVRFCLSAAHTPEQLKVACDLLEQVGGRMGMLYNRPMVYMYLPEFIVRWLEARNSFPISKPFNFSKPTRLAKTLSN